MKQKLRIFLLTVVVLACTLGQTDAADDGWKIEVPKRTGTIKIVTAEGVEQIIQPKQPLPLITSGTVVEVVSGIAVIRIGKTEIIMEKGGMIQVWVYPAELHVELFVPPACTSTVRVQVFGAVASMRGGSRVSVVSDQDRVTATIRVLAGTVEIMDAAGRRVGALGETFFVRLEVEEEVVEPEPVAPPVEEASEASFD